MCSGCEKAQAWLVCGAPGSGKSVLGRALAADVGAVLLDQDVLTGPLTGVVARLVGAEPEDLDDPRLRAALGGAPYDALLDTARDNLAIGRDIVVIAPFTLALGSEAAVRATAERLATTRIHVVWADCHPDELLRRLRERGSARDRRKLADFATWLARVRQPPAAEHVRVDTSLPIDAQLAVARIAPDIGLS